MKAPIDPIKWNYLFPIDYWWRRKHKIPFGSEAHLSMSFIDMAFEFAEDKFFAQMLSSDKNEPQKISTPYIKGKGDIFDDSIISSDIDDSTLPDDMFDDIDDFLSRVGDDDMINLK